MDKVASSFSTGSSYLLDERKIALPYLHCIGMATIKEKVCRRVLHQKRKDQKNLTVLVRLALKWCKKPASLNRKRSRLNIECGWIIEKKIAYRKNEEET